MIKQIAASLLALALSWTAFAATPVNVNKADAATLATSLDGIGPTKAAAIVSYRDEHGPFKSVDDLTHVKGIGPATLERNRSAILLSDSDAPAKPAAAAPAPAKAAPAASKPAGQ
ncbi:ComEA family DNA-binding protein [Dyella telluris]|uniref:Helix-hairpin-helix domain-containing protein n=1 Tax=Dyella telluris TaxID=2763498 RepID=A0A7G8Q118_9GAMM|nr:helix-hairpin-helix domain-containing protein [Dyella telluris]QNK00476.1 helix-hairpin-helix domain-containing protein [Dyella telluris]